LFTYPWAHLKGKCTLKQIFALFTSVNPCDQSVDKNIFGKDINVEVWHKLCLVQTTLSSGESRPGIWGAPKQWGAKNVYFFKYPRLSATIGGYHTKVVTFCRWRK